MKLCVLLPLLLLLHLGCPLPGEIVQGSFELMGLGRPALQRPHGSHFPLGKIRCCTCMCPWDYARTYMQRIRWSGASILVRGMWALPLVYGSTVVVAVPLLAHAQGVVGPSRRTPYRVHDRQRWAPGRQRFPKTAWLMAAMSMASTMRFFSYIDLADIAAVIGLSPLHPAECRTRPCCRQPSETHLKRLAIFKAIFNKRVCVKRFPYRIERAVEGIRTQVHNSRSTPVYLMAVGRPRRSGLL